jgi:predicted solute-binding protein
MSEDTAVVSSEVVSSEVAASAPVARNPGRKRDPQSKMSLAREIFTRLAGQSSKEVKAAFRSELQLPQASANTYYHNIKRELSNGQ